MTMTMLQVLGGLAIFIFGMSLMSSGLQRVAGEKMRIILRMFSANRLVAVASGAAVTCVIQSSSASTVMVWEPRARAWRGAIPIFRGSPTRARQKI